MSDPSAEAATRGISLRRAGPHDREVLAALHAACFEDRWDAAAMAGLLAAPGTMARLALAGDSPVGLVIARAAAGEAEVLTIGVLPAQRRRGIGRLLLDSAAADAAARGAEALFLEVAEDDPGARRFYAAAGFAEIGRRPAYYRRADGRRVAALVLRRNLRNRK